MSDFTAAVALKNGLYTYAKDTLWTADKSVQVSYGHPGQTQFPDLVAFTDWEGEQEPITLSTRRQREEILQVVVMFSIYRAGGPEQEKIATDRLMVLFGQLEKYTRETDTTIGGVVRDCFLTSFSSAGSQDPQLLSTGRLVEARAVFAAHNRVTS